MFDCALQHVAGHQSPVARTSANSHPAEQKSALLCAALHFFCFDFANGADGVTSTGGETVNAPIYCIVLPGFPLPRPHSKVALPSHTRQSCDYVLFMMSLVWQSVGLVSSAAIVCVCARAVVLVHPVRPRTPVTVHIPLRFIMAVVLFNPRPVPAGRMHLLRVPCVMFCLRFAAIRDGMDETIDEHSSWNRMCSSV